ncbi:MAG: rhamnulokinase [Acidobacteriaceae bacterium]
MSLRPALVAIDLGAESCRVSLLQWQGDTPAVRMVHRFANGPIHQGKGLHWEFTRICRELFRGLRQCATLAPEGIASIGVTGWAVDYVRLDRHGNLNGQPFCYRDPRNAQAMEEVHKRLTAERLYAITGVQIQPINTVYQLYADQLSGIPASTPWVNLPEYILHWLGAPRVAEYTNATHTALIDTDTRQWSREIFDLLELDISAAPEIVPAGTQLGTLANHLRALPAFRNTQLIAPACHDTASAIAGIPADGNSWAYISSGTWSLVGTTLTTPNKTVEACHKGFTNLGGAGDTVLFHRGIPGMWLLRQCMNEWQKSSPCTVQQLVAAAQAVPAPDYELDLDDPAFLTPGDMPERINQQVEARNIQPLASGCDAAPAYASLIFHSLARRYASVLQNIHTLTGKSFDRICIVGGGSRNQFLNDLASQAAGVPVERCSPESSTLGNFAVQFARLESPEAEIDTACITRHAGQLLPAI